MTGIDAQPELCCRLRHVAQLRQLPGDSLFGGAICIIAGVKFDMGCATRTGGPDLFGVRGDKRTDRDAVASAASR